KSGGASVPASGPTNRRPTLWLARPLAPPDRTPKASCSIERVTCEVDLIGLSVLVRDNAHAVPPFDAFEQLLALLNRSVRRLVRAKKPDEFRRRKHSRGAVTGAPVNAGDVQDGASAVLV